MDLRGDDFLVDHLSVVDPKKCAFNMLDLSASSANSLKRSMFRNGGWTFKDSEESDTKYRQPIQLFEISNLTIQDIRDVQYVGEAKLILLINELKASVLRHVDYSPIMHTKDSSFPESVTYFEISIEESETFEALNENMFQYLKSEFELSRLRSTSGIIEMDHRTEAIWRSRLLFLTDAPITLDELGKTYGITRERVRQIQNLAAKFPFSKRLKIDLLFQMQDILLESSSYRDFLETLCAEKYIESESISLGRIRFTALEFGYVDIAADIEKSIYRWANQIL